MPNMPLTIHEKSKKIYLFDWLDQTGEISQYLSGFSDLIQAPEEVQTFHLSPYALWTAAAKGMRSDEIIEFLERNAVHALSERFKEYIRNMIHEFDMLRFSFFDEYHFCIHSIDHMIAKICGIDFVKTKIVEASNSKLLFLLRDKLEIKKLLFQNEIYWKDETYEVDKPFTLRLMHKTADGNPFSLYDFQIEAVEAFMKNNHHTGGGGTLVLPPNSGKTLIALSIMEKLMKTTLIIVENDASLEGWVNEILDKTDVTKTNISLVDKSNEEIKSITIGTYDYISSNMDKFSDYSFGIIIFDDAHKLPTDTHEVTVNIPSQFKLAIASTLARSDQRGGEVLSLVGPKWFEVLPRTLIKKEFHVPVQCIEVRTPLSEFDDVEYSKKLNRDSHLRRVAALNQYKDKVLTGILKKYQGKRIIIVSFRLELTERYKRMFNIEVISSDVDKEKVREVVDHFNNGQTRIFIAASLTLEKIRLHSVDTIINVSYDAGSEREEYLRIGKLLPSDGLKKEGVFISVVSANTIEEKDYNRRRRKMIQYGYHYSILDADQFEWGV